MFRGKMFVILCSLLLAGCAITTGDSSYDYSASVECLAEPMDPQYGGGLIANPNFDSGLDVWEAYGNGNMTIGKSKTGNNFMVAYNRSKIFDSVSHSFYLQKDLLYTFSAWLQTNKEKAIVNAFLKNPNGTYLIVGSVIAQSGCWSMLKGGFTVDQNTKAELFFQSKNTEVELWVDNASLKPFTKIEWQEQQNKSIDKVRKRKIRIHVTSQDGIKLSGANITINQTRPHFLIGCSTTAFIANTTAYQDWFASRFPATTFNNEMKWYYTEPQQGQENYTITDAMVAFFRKNNISIRGHAIHWASKNVTQYWVKALSPRETLNFAIRRMGSVISRYAGDVIGWDVVNENLHNTYYEDKIGLNSSSMFYQIAHAMDPETPLFLNEFNTLEYPMDMKVMPSKYVEKIKETKAFPGNDHMGLRIGLQGHFILKPNVSYIRPVFDVLGATKNPIWLTELDTKRGPDQAAQLEDVMREAFSHPAVEGIIVWAGWKPTACNERCLNDTNYNDVLPHGCAEMCLTDNNFKNRPPGDVVDKLLKEWKTTNVTGNTDEKGIFEQKVFHGEYSLTYSHPLVPRTVERKFNVTNDKGTLDLYVTL